MALQVVIFATLCLMGALHLRDALPRINALQPVEGHHGLPPLTETLFLATCLPLLVTEVVGYLSNQGDVWIVAATLTENQVANFGAARRFVMAISMPLMAINLMVLPSIPQLYVQRRTADLQRLLQRNATAALIPALCVLLVTLCGPGTVLSLLYGSDYSGAGTCLVILCAGQVFHMFTGSCGQLLMLTGRERLVLMLYVVAGVLLFTLGPMVAVRYGLNGVAIVSASILVFENLVLWILARVLLGVWTHASPASLGDAMRELSRLLSRRGRSAPPIPSPLIEPEDKLKVGEVLGNG
jgi:O-antigen/teichoic acid export membrane protein